MVIGGGVEEGEERGGEVAAEGVGLVGPVEAVRAAGVFGERVFSLVVIFQNLIYELLFFFHGRFL